MPIISGSKGIPGEIPHIPKGIEQKVAELVMHCRGMNGADLYKMVAHELPEWFSDPAIENMLAIAGKNGTLAQYKALMQQENYEAAAELLPSPEFVANCLEQLKNPAIFREFQKFQKGHN